MTTPASAVGFRIALAQNVCDRCDDRATPVESVLRLGKTIGSGTSARLRIKKDVVTRRRASGVTKGTSFATWLMNVGARTTLGKTAFPVKFDARYTLQDNDPIRSSDRIRHTTPGQTRKAHTSVRSCVHDAQ